MWDLFNSIYEWFGVENPKLFIVGATLLGGSVSGLLCGFLAFVIHLGHLKVERRRQAQAQSLESATLPTSPIVQLRANSTLPPVSIHVFYTQVGGIQITNFGHAPALTVSAWNRAQDYIQVTSVRLVNLWDGREKKINTDAVAAPHPAAPCEEDVTIPLLEMLSGSSRPGYVDWNRVYGSYRISVTLDYQLQGGKRSEVGPDEYDVDIKPSGTLTLVIKVSPHRE